MALYLVSFLLLGAAHAASVPAVSPNDQSLPAAIDRRATGLYCTKDIPNCSRCDYYDTARCRICATGYTPTNGGSQCVMIRCGIYDCLECMPAPLTCTKCADGLAFVDGVCQQPAPAPPIDGNPSPPPPQPAPCNVAGCDTCSFSNPNVCLTCQPGTTIMNNGAQCLASQVTCPDPNCVSCSVGAPDTCLACNAAGYTLVEGKCLSNACVVPGCTKCVAGNPNYCSRCQSGMTPSGGKCYYISCGIKNCQKCIAGPNTCTQCVPGFTQNAAATDCVPIV